MNSDGEICWEKIILDLDLEQHDFRNPFFVKHSQVKDIVSIFKDIPNNRKEIRKLGHMIRRKDRPRFFKKKNIFLLPSSNREWVLLRGDGYFDPEYKDHFYKSKIIDKAKNFNLETLKGQSEGRYIHQINADGILNDFVKNDKLIFTLSGRKYATFAYKAFGHNLQCAGAQIEIDAGFEAKDEVILIEAKTGEVGSEIIRQLYFPYKYVSSITQKKVRSIFMVVADDRKSVSLFEYHFNNDVYEGIQLLKSEKYLIT